MVAQFGVKKIREMVEMLVVEVDQQKNEEYISSESASSAKKRCYCCMRTRVMDLHDKKIPIHQELFGSLDSSPMG